MARRWTKSEENVCRKELLHLYVRENRTISEIGKILHLASGSIYDRLRRLGIHTCRNRKTHFNNRRNDIALPKRSSELAELMGCMLGDGCLTHYQVTVTLGTKELSYAKHIKKLMRHLFGGTPKISIRSNGHKVVYLGSTLATDWLFSEGLVRNKMRAQVGVPKWIFSRREYMKSFLRGFFDTDGSIYKLRYGVQMSFCNRSMPLLCSLQTMLQALGYKPSAISGYNLYLTRKSEIQRFFRDVKPANLRHFRRYREMMRRWQSGNCTTL